MTVSPWIEFLLPNKVATHKIDSLKKVWATKENEYCQRIIKPAVVVLSFLMIPLFFISKNGADFEFTVLHRMIGVTLFLGCFLSLKYDVWRKKIFAFAYYKLIFISVAACLLTLEQIQMFKYSEMPRFYAPLALVLILSIARLSMKPTMLLIILSWFSLFMTGFIIKDQSWNDIWTDFAYLTVASVISLVVTKIYELKVELFVATSSEKDESAKKESHVLSEMRKLVYPHMVNLIESGKELNETMPVGSNKAYALYFNVCGSSKVSHELFDQTMQTFMGKCVDLMMRGYNTKKLESTAYKARQTEDGFLCTVGFPFSTPKKSRGAEVALELAEKFVEIFDIEIAKLEYPEEIFCSVGICWDQIEGYFPEHGIGQYDLKGKAISRAPRYEAYRKLVFNSDSDYPGNIITISNQVHNNLPSYTRGRFKKSTHLNSGGASENTFYYWARPKPPKEDTLPEIKLGTAS